MKKEKLRGIILGATISTAILIPKDNAYAAELNTKGTVQNVSSFLRIRENASTSSAIVGELKNNTVVDIKEKKGDWYKIQHGNVSGYVYDEYINVAVEEPRVLTASKSSNTGYVTNVSTSLRLRQGPSTSTNVIDYLRNGQALKIEGQENNWYKVSVNGKTGYVSKDYVKLSTSSSTNNSTSSSSGSSSNNSHSSTTSGTIQNYATKNGTLQNVSSSLRIRSTASTTGSVLGYIYPGTTFKIIGESGSWYYVDVNGKKGYASKEYIKITSASSSSSSTNNNSSSSGSSSNNSQNSTSSGTTQSYAVKNGTLQNVSSSLKIRSTASTTGSVLGYIYPGTTFKIIGESGSWYHVDVNGKKGYASKTYIKIVTASSSSNSNSSSSHESSSEHVSATYEKVFSLMKQQIGSPYVYGGAGEELTSSLLDRLKAENPSYASAGKYDNAAREVGKGYKAFDCSGLMYWAFKQVGINIGRSTYSQINSGIEVPLNDLKPGDLLFYSNLGHVGMYIGNGQWIESPNHNGCVRITNVPWKSIGRARRVL
ncbi:MAG: SH3 domain-containing protein [Inconstantimicrobium porci]|uniref:C40 family peptidase n=1 Tax=Inconstantimicrobium porci TaxID=2652291 RepID=UPI002A91148B|nr:SH3 domain-containing protein [Inconstantimicrobium porci]MDY5913520.1 SH3 domain-containing protein [Inconstantimicrobium porci]